MNFQQTIMAMNAGLAGCDGNGQPGSAGPDTAQTREVRNLLDSLAKQFDTHVGQSVICLPMSDYPPDP